MNDSIAFAVKHDLTQGEMRVILALQEGKTTTMSIAKQLNITKQRVGQILTRLRLKGVVRRDGHGHKNEAHHYEIVE